MMLREWSLSQAGAFSIGMRSLLGLFMLFRNCLGFGHRINLGIEWSLYMEGGARRSGHSCRARHFVGSKVGMRTNRPFAGAANAETARICGMSVAAIN
jgi:hypothetical protein